MCIDIRIYPKKVVVFDTELNMEVQHPVRTIKEAVIIATNVQHMKYYFFNKFSDIVISDFSLMDEED